jgi:transcriptional regulator with XRE-family HTH domain
MDISRETFLAMLAARPGSKSAKGRELGVSHTAVSGWLSGRINPSDTVLKLAALLWADAGNWPLSGGG